MKRKCFGWALMICLCTLVAMGSLHANAMGTHHVATIATHLQSAQELKITGGADVCAAGAGVAVGVALGVFSPCSFVCLALSFYVIGGMLVAGC